MSFSVIVQFILAIPKIIDLISSIIGFVKKVNEENKAENEQKSIDKLQKAKTESEVKDAAKDYLANS